MDFNDASGATLREVDKSERNGSPTRIVRASRTYPTSQQDLWSALTEKERVVRWFADVSGDFKLGGRFAIRGNAEGEIITCEPPRTLSLTWEFSGNISWVRVTVEEAEDVALLTLEHEMPTDEASEAHWAQYGPGATGVGWEMAFLGLDVHLSGDGEPSLDAGAAWAEGTQARETFRTWSRAWGDAYVKAGAPRQTANDMADRCAAFYAGES